MSPEQARGQQVDKRTDNWAFGCLFYEMLTGRPAFEGGTLTDVLASIVHKEPDLEQLPARLPENVRNSLRRCLQKDANQRLRDIGDLRIELQEALRIRSTPAARASTARRPKRPRSREKWIGAAVGIGAVLVLLVLARIFVRQESVAPAGTGTNEKVMLAVLPFENLGGDPEQEFFSDGVTEEVITQLSKLSPERLGVIARTSAMHYKNTDRSIEQIGEELGVDYILEGSVRHAGDRVRIAAQLVDVVDQAHLWADSYERDRSDVFAIQGEVAGAVAEALSVELLPEQAERLARAATENVQAHEAYLRGLYHWNRRTDVDIRRSIDYFETAIELDPDYAQGHAGLAAAWVVLPDYSDVPAAEVIPRVHRAINLALELDPQLAEARAPEVITASYEYDWERAERVAREVLEEAPGYGTGRHWLAWTLSLQGRFDEAIDEIRRARELDPLSLIINSNVGQMLLYAGRYEEGLAELARTLEMSPDFFVARRFTAIGHSMLGQHEEAIALARELYDERPDVPNTLADLAWAHARAGQTDEATVLLERTDWDASGRRLDGARVLTGLGRYDEAIELLERARREETGALRYILPDHAFAPLHDDPRFREILRSMNLADRP
jgi:TolB-like protein